MRPVFRARRVVAYVAVLSFVLSGCVATTNRNIEKFDRSQAGLKVLFMPLDVELSELTAGGAKEPKADWTEAANKHLKTAIQKTFEGRNARLVSYAAPLAGSETEEKHTQLIKLHSVVGNTILLNQLIRPIPTKENKFDWTLGDEAKNLRSAANADYALFVYVRDSYASGGRAAAMVLAAVLLGAALPGGQQFGFASLVDLRSGKIVWFNRLTRGGGDLRTAPEAAETAEVLLEKLPD